MSTIRAAKLQRAGREEGPGGGNQALQSLQTNEFMAVGGTVGTRSCFWFTVNRIATDLSNSL
jgi:hypothetical protein